MNGWSGLRFACFSARLTALRFLHAGVQIGPNERKDRPRHALDLGLFPVEGIGADGHKGRQPVFLRQITQRLIERPVKSKRLALHPITAFPATVRPSHRADTHLPLPALRRPLAPAPSSDSFGSSHGTAPKPPARIPNRSRPPDTRRHRPDSRCGALHVAPATAAAIQTPRRILRICTLRSLLMSCLWDCFSGILW